MDGRAVRLDYVIDGEVIDIPAHSRDSDQHAASHLAKLRQVRQAVPRQAEGCAALLTEVPYPFSAIRARQRAE